MKNPSRIPYSIPAVHMPRGFALVVSLTMLVLLTIIAVGLLSLSAITLRSSTQTSAMAEAQANARMALMIAIGELQKQMGPDQRISANSSILAESQVPNPHWMGVWDSWKAGPTSDDADNPSDPSDHRTIPASSRVRDGIAPTYAPNRRDHFRSWMLSLNAEELRDIDAPNTSDINVARMPSGENNGVILVGDGSLGPARSTDAVGARLIPVRENDAANPSGRYAWWVGDESQKARVMGDSHEITPSNTVANRMFRQQAPGSMGTRTMIGLENVQDTTRMSALPSLLSVSLVDGATSDAALNFHGITPYSYKVLADVREGGLKRDLSTLRERTVNINETSDEFMLYSFTRSRNDPNVDRVSIQDLKAFYQLYDQTRYAGTPEAWRQGVLYNSNRIPGAVQIAQPDLGDQNSRDRFLRRYERMYLSSVPVKIQILVTMTAHPIREEDLVPNGNTHYIRLHMMPAVTMWNPTNLPLVMNLPNNLNFAQQMRFMSAGFNFNWIKNNQPLTTPRPLNLSFVAMGGDNNNGRPGWANAGGKKATIFDMYFSTPNNPIIFEPGEVRVFSYDRAVAGDGAFQFRKAANDSYQSHQQAVAGWNPDVLFPMANSIWGNPANDPNIYTPPSGGRFLAVRAGRAGTDQIAIRLTTDQEDGTDYAHDSEWPGVAFGYMMIQNNHQSRQTNMWSYRNYPALSRRYSSPTGQNAYGARINTQFNDALLRKGFPSEPLTINRNVRELINITESGEHWPLFQFSLMSAVETSEASSMGSFGGRKFASRPFLHSSPLSPPHIDSAENNAFYNYGLNWWIEEVNSILEANVQVDADNRRGYFGGGYTPDFGTTHVIQQEIPLVPPISIAGLSHSLLGGYSLANEIPNQSDPVVSAIGAGGMFPFTVRAIGNSYAHPLLNPDEAFNRNWQRHFDGSGQPRTMTLADHSYLANKALWDQYFFSSITPQNASVRPFGLARNRTARNVAEEFFFENGTLPNRRIVPHTNKINEVRLAQLFDSADEVNDGLADKIAALLMVEGPFNVNSTSVDAWRALLSSMQGKPVAYLDPRTAMSGDAIREATTEGVPISGFGLPFARPLVGSESDPRIPEQWLAWRELTSSEIDELAEAIVRQVKLRGPFLSMSEFVNRRLDRGNRELSVKGALQAAIDDPNVSINAGFRNAERQFSAQEIASMNPAFSEALAGPVAYGSATYVDQADVLRLFAEQLTPRGDTFVIRTYGDSLDAAGNVQARAWCEAVVQRFPDYVDSRNEPHIKPADSAMSEANRMYGRKIELISFRWLNPSEV